MSKNSSSKADLLGGSAAARLQVVRRFSLSRSILLVAHDRPDGDSLGCMVGLARAARAAGRVARVVCGDPVARHYQFLLAGEDLLDIQGFAEAAPAAELICVVDTCAWEQLRGSGETIRAHGDKVVVIDHHKTSDDVGTVRWLDVTAAAVAVMAAELLERLDWPTDATTARALLAAICSDTGWMRFSNTDGRTLRVAARLIDLGAEPADIYERIYQNDRPERLALVARVLAGLSLHCGGRLAVMQATRADLAASGAAPEETENIINEALRIGSVEVAALLVENESSIRASLRGRRLVDVAKLAAKFGGGGHERAAGFRSTEKLDAVRKQIIAAAEKVLGC